MYSASSRHALQPQNVVRVRLAVGDDLTLLHVLALEHADVAPLRDQLLVPSHRPSVVITSRCLPLVSLPKLTVPDASARMRRLLGLARLEQVGNPRQTAGDVAGLGRLLRNTRDDVADVHLSAIRQVDDGAGRQEVVAGISVPGSVSVLPFSSISLTMGRRSLPALPRCFGIRCTDDGRSAR